MTTLAAAAIVTLAAVACGKKDTVKATPSVKASPSTLTYAVSGGSNAVQMTSNGDWTLDGYTSDVQKWLTVTPSSGNSSDAAQVITFTAAANTGLERTATITFKQVEGTAKATVAVSQAAYYPPVSTSTASAVSKLTDVYKYQSYQLTGVVKNLKNDGTFDLVDETGTIVVNGLSASEVAYGTAGGALANVKERDTVTIIGYVVNVSGKNQVSYAYLVKVVTYSEPSADAAETVNFPYSATFTKGADKFFVNNKVFPYAFDALWTNSTAEGWTANAYNASQKYATESWLISPMINMTGAKAPVLVFNHIVQFFQNIDVAKDQTSLWVRKKGGSWTKLAISFSYPDDLGSSVMTSENINLKDYIGATIQFAFKYVSDETNEAGKWQIIDFNVKEDEEPAQGDNTDGAEDYNKPGWDWNN